MTDDEKTPRYRKQWGVDSERARHRQTSPRGMASIAESISMGRDRDEITEPIDLLLDSELEPDDASIVERLRRDSQDPYEMILKLAKSQRKQKVKEQSGLTQLESAVVQAIQYQERAMRDVLARVGGLEVKVAESQRPWKWLRAIAGALLIPALGAIITGMGLMLSRSEHEGESTIRMQRMESDVQELLREARHRSPAP